MTTRIKICGLRDERSIDAAIDAGATHVGLVHYEKSPRHLPLDRAAALRRHAAGRVKTVLLLVNATPLVTGHALDAVQPDVIQFHGTETPQWTRLIRDRGLLAVWKAFGVEGPGSLTDAVAYDGCVDMMLYDAPARALPGGNGAAFDWRLLAHHQHRIAWGLAGGLSPDNVADAIRATGASLVDTSSGVESAPGVKCVDKIAAFCQAVRDYDTTALP